MIFVLFIKIKLKMIDISSDTVVLTFIITNSILLFYILALVLYNLRNGCKKKNSEKENILKAYKNNKFSLATLQTDL